MSPLRKILPVIVSVATIVSVMTACSTQKNTSTSRWWHSFSARYNTYYNGAQAYIEGSLAKESGNKDNYTEMLPLYTVGNKASRELGKSNFETAITKAEKAIKQHSIKKKPEWTKNRRKTEKDIEWLSRREYNPFIWKAWMLMGRSQFYSGSFDEAAATFSYMSRLYRTQPAIYGKARAWLAKCYIEQDWIYDAEDVIRNMKRDSIDWRAQKEWDYTYADYYLHTGDLEKSAQYLNKVIKHEMRSKQKTREWFLLGQVYAAQKKDKEAYNALKHVIRLNPPYELEFNARIAMTEVMPNSQPKSKISRLKRMARSDKNADYLDQVYYALGNVYLAEKDTAKAIGAYEKGNEKATRSGIEKGVLLLHLGDLYWQIEKFGDAQRCYGEAIGLLDKDRPDYQQLSDRSKILDELAPHTDNIHLQDSLQELAKMSEKDRNAAIDRVIEALKKKEKEEKLKQLDAQAQRNNAQGNVNGNNNRNTAQRTTGNKTAGTFYFYSTTAVQQGKTTFQQLWGKRENVDNWQRANRTVVASAIDDNNSDQLANDSIAAGGDTAIGDSLNSKDKAEKDSAAMDPHKREYYLAQIPFTEEQLEASNAILSDALFNAGIIFKDKLDNLYLSERTLKRLNTTFPDFEKTDEVYYHLFLLYSRKGEPETANQFKELLAERYPESQWTTIVNDPYFEENARYGEHLEDSLYAETYHAFCNDQYDVVARNAKTSEERFKLGAHHDKFIFISGLSRLNQGDIDSCMNAMDRVVKEYPQSEVSTIAGMIINGVKNGRKLHGAKFDIGNIWDYRAEVLSENGDSTEQKFSDDPNQEFLFLMTYSPESLALATDTAVLRGTVVENQLLYEIARFNFTSYLVRNFDIDIEEYNGMHRLSVSGFQNYDEALVYARNLYQNSRIKQLSAGSRNIIISTQNLALLGSRFSYNDYDKFYAEHFAPLPQPEPSLLNEQIVKPELYDPENQSSTSTNEEEDNEEQAQPVSSGNNTVEDNFFIPEETKKPIENKQAEDEFTIPEETKKPVEQKQNENDFIIPEETKKPVEQKQDENEFIIPEEVKKPVEVKKAIETKPVEVKKPVVVQKKEATTSTTTTRQDINSDILEIIDEDAPVNQKTTTKKKEEKAKKEKDDDEYFDLDGF